MDYKKKYESVVDRLQGLIANGKKQGHIIIRIEDIENAISELKENDENIIEWIRKELESKYVVENRVTNIYADKAFSWLEKQSKTKSEWSDVDEYMLNEAIRHLEILHSKQRKL